LDMRIGVCVFCLW